MDKRTLLALALMAIVLVVTPMFFKQPRPPAPVVDTTAAATATSPVTTATANGTAPVAPTPTPSLTTPAPVDTGRIVKQPPTMTTFATPKAEFVLTNPGAAPTSVKVSAFRDLSPKTPKGTPV